MITREGPTAADGVPVTASMEGPTAADDGHVMILLQGPTAADGVHVTTPRGGPTAATGALGTPLLGGPTAATVCRSRLRGSHGGRRWACHASAGGPKRGFLEDKFWRLGLGRSWGGPAVGLEVSWRPLVLKMHMYCRDRSPPASRTACARGGAGPDPGDMPNAA